LRANFELDVGDIDIHYQYHPTMILCLCLGVSERVVRLAVMNGAGSCVYAIENLVDDMREMRDARDLRMDGGAVCAPIPANDSGRRPCAHGESSAPTVDSASTVAAGR